MRLLRYAFDEAAASLWRGRRSGLLSTATIAIALFVLGAFLVVTSNLERLAEEWSGAAELSVYLADDISGADRASLERELRGDPSVTGVEYVTKDAALTRFKTTFPDLAQTLGALPENPLPASLDVPSGPRPARRPESMLSSRGCDRPRACRMCAMTRHGSTV
jgi:cell division transport system permease protein